MWAAKCYVEAMQVTIDIPESNAAALESGDKDPARRALEAWLVEGYRNHLLNEGQIKRLLGFGTRMQVHALLLEHGVPQHYTEELMRQDIAASEELHRMRTTKRL